MTMENEAFLNCMIPGEGPVTREEFDKFRLSVGRLWQAFWTFRHVMNVSDEDWSKEILELVESLGGLEKASEKWKEHKRKISHVLNDEQKTAIVEGTKEFFIGLDVNTEGITSRVISAATIVEGCEDFDWNAVLNFILVKLGATEEELEDKTWEEDNGDVGGSTESS